MLAALAASLCCIGPAAALALGAGGFAASALFEKWRPLFLGLTFTLLAMAWYFTYRKPKPGCAPSSACPARSASRWSKAPLWFATASVLVVAAFPSFASVIRGRPQRNADGAAPALADGSRAVLKAKTPGMDCPACALGALSAVPKQSDVQNAQANSAAQGAVAQDDATKLSPDRISLYSVPLVCPADPQIGCGSAAKPILLALEREPTVSQAWLNRAGTATAVVWKENIKAKSRSATLRKFLETRNFQAKEMTGAVRERALKGFLSGKGWYRGRDADRLSEEEAGVIAGRLVRTIRQRVVLTDEKAKGLQTQLAAVIARRLTGQLPDRSAVEEEVMKVLHRHFSEKDVSLLQEGLKDFRPAGDGR